MFSNDQVVLILASGKFVKGDQFLFCLFLCFLQVTSEKSRKQRALSPPVLNLFYE